MDQKVASRCHGPVKKPPEPSTTTLRQLANEGTLNLQCKMKPINLTSIVEKTSEFPIIHRDHYSALRNMRKCLRLAACSIYDYRIGPTSLASSVPAHRHQRADGGAAAAARSAMALCFPPLPFPSLPFRIPYTGIIFAPP